MTATESMGEYAVAKVSVLLEDVVSAIQGAANEPAMETVHKMRVAIRRLQQGLRLFRPYVRKSGADQIKQELRDIMKIAGELRNYDIAIGLVNEKHGESNDITESLSGERLKAEQRLADGLQRYANRDRSLRWRSKLGLKQA
jgi:CHAD domain-containing protein